MDPFSDWEQSLSQSDLDAIEAAFESASSSPSSSSSLLKRKNNFPPENSRRLPNWSTQQQQSNSNNNQNQFQSRVCSSESGTNFNSGSKSVSNSNSSGSGFYSRNPNWKALRPHQVSAKLKHPAIKFGGRIIYCTTFSEVEKASVELVKHIKAKQNDKDQISLGFDIEWKPTFRRGEVPRKAAVMQICGDTSRCYVLHIIHSGIPPTLQSLLEDPKYVKVGVAVSGDADKIFNDYNIRVKSLEDLSWLANQKLDGFPKRWSLASLTEMLTCKELEKPNKIRLGNWEVKVLSKDQLMYAATDAFVSWHLYEILKSFPDLPQPLPEEKVEALPS